MSLAKRREFLMRERWFSLWDKVEVMDPATQGVVGHFQRKLLRSVCSNACRPLSVRRGCLCYQFGIGRLTPISNCQAGPRGIT
jgi:hypothetical protein